MLEVRIAPCVQVSWLQVNWLQVNGQQLKRAQMKVKEMMQIFRQPHYENARSEYKKSLSINALVNKIFIKAALASGVLFMWLPAQAETFYEVSASVSEYAIDITSKRGIASEDNSTALNFSLGAYRQASSYSAWGGVIEYSLPLGREDDLPGNGTLLGIRPINYLRYITNSLSLEFYGGFAQYDWFKNANGYYGGLNLRYDIVQNVCGVAIDVKYYQDLAFDNAATGDEIVDGFNTGAKFFYRF